MTLVIIVKKGFGRGYHIGGGIVYGEVLELETLSVLWRLMT